MPFTSSDDPHRNIDSSSVPSYALRIWTAWRHRAVRLIGLVAARLLRPSALEDAAVRKALWKVGVAAQPQGFYSSMIDPGECHDSTSPSAYPAVNLNPSLQLKYLKDLFPRFRDEFALLPLERPPTWDAQPRFFLRNDAFNDVDALAYWAMIRLHRPRKIVEIGSGHSTLLAAQAVQANGRGHVVAIDPYPRAFVRRNDLGIQIMNQEVQRVPFDYFGTLEADDILFIDSSHVVRRGGDTTFMLLDVLPRLNDGVIVHIHDIHIPFDYPLHLIRNRNLYWTEQYLLHAYLVNNICDEVLFGARFCAHYFPQETRQAFPTASSLEGASFWLRSHRLPVGTPAKPSSG